MVVITMMQFIIDSDEYLFLNCFYMFVQFIVDMHYKVSTTAHHRHKCNHLAGIEVLVNLLGFRAAIPSTFK